MSISELRAQVHLRSLDHRAMDRLVHSKEFEQAFSLDPDNVFIHFSIMSGDTHTVETWIEATLKRQIGELSMRKLRDLASRLGIAFYTSLSKPDLIARIIQVQHDRRTQEVPIGMPP